jgi:Na+/melibiose symporter-like transporter
VCCSAWTARRLIAVWWASFEREEFRTRPARLGFVEGMRITARHRNFRHLTGLYLAGRVAMDLVGTMLILYFTHYIARSRDFEWSLMLFLAAAVLSLPLWLRISEHTEKVTVSASAALGGCAQCFSCLRGRVGLGS